MGARFMPAIISQRVSALADGTDVNAWGEDYNGGTATQGAPQFA